MLSLITKVLYMFGVAALKLSAILPRGIINLFTVEKHYHYHGGAYGHKDGQVSK